MSDEAGPEAGDASGPGTTGESGLETLLVGIDAGCLPTLERLFDRDAVPTIEGLFDRGVSGELTSQVPPWTASAWPSLYTGANPGRHGTFSFLTFEGYDWAVVDRTTVREHALWELLDRRGKSSVVVNVPVTHPPRGFDGALIPGYVAPEDPPCHPAGLLAEVRDAVGEYRVYREGRMEDLDRDELLAGYRRLTRSRGEAFRYLVDRFDPEFGFLQFQQTDTVFHELPGDEAAVEAVYRAVDDQLERTIAATDPGTVVLASDHGIGPYGGREFRVNEYLRRHGWVETTTGGEGMPSWTARFEAGGDEGTGNRLLERAVGAAARAGLTAQRVKRLLDAVGLTGAVVDRVPLSVRRSGAERVDFRASRAYMRTRTELGVTINAAADHPDGVVGPDEYDRIREELVALLSAARTPEGDPVFDRVAPREAFFEGPYVGEAPDVIAVPADFDHLVSASLPGEQFGSAEGEWNHKREGVVAIAGSAVDGVPGSAVGDAPLEDAHLFDIAPTVLATLGVPASDRMDGAVLSPVDDAGVTSYPPFESGTETDTGDAAVERRLADLGYIE